MKKVSFVKTDELGDMAQAACDSYEFNCDWKLCADVAREYCIDEFGKWPRASVCYAAVNQAKSIWEGRVINAQKNNA